MFAISSDQFESTSNAMHARFVAQSIEFLRATEKDWSEEKTDAQIEAFIEASLGFAKDHNITTARAVQRIMRIKLRIGFYVPLDPVPALKLTQAGMSEARRVDAFQAALQQEDAPVLITLDTDLSTIG